jgi:uncharacterized protein YjiS (DUF1127 family)
MNAERCEAISRTGNPCRRYAVAELARPVCRLHATPREREHLQELQDAEHRRRLARWFLEGEGRVGILAERFAEAVARESWDAAERWLSATFAERDEALRVLMENAQA